VEWDIRSGELSFKPNDSDLAAIRLAGAGDARRIAVLCQQLGYPASREEVERRLRAD